jgi:hypothetical protein
VSTLPLQQPAKKQAILPIAVAIAKAVMNICILEQSNIKAMSNGIVARYAAKE